MSRRLLRQLLTSFGSQHLRRRTASAAPPATATPARRFCSGADGPDDPFAPLRCYSVRDPDTPYYVIEHPFPPASGKDARAVPDELLLARWNVEHLTCNYKGPEERDGDAATSHVYLVGVDTDEKSAEQIKDIIVYLKPEVILLELCGSRRLLLTFDKVKGSKWVQVQHHVSCVAFEEAICSGVKVILGDRPFDITVRRVLEGMLEMRILEFTKLSFFLLLQFMDYGKDNKVFNINDFIHKKLKELTTFPSLLQPAIHERSLYMSSVLAKVAKDNRSVMAVVGRDHVAEMKNNWCHIVQAEIHASESQ